MHNRPHDVDHLFGRKVVGVRQHRHRGRLLVIPAVPDPQLIHLPIAFGAKLHPRKGVNAIVDAGVHRHKAAEHLRIGRVDNGIGPKPRDVALPDGQAVPDHRDVRKGHNPLFLRPHRQISVLHAQHVVGHLPRHTDIHQRTQKGAFTFIILWRFQIFIFSGVGFERVHEEIQPLRLSC